MELVGKGVVHKAFGDGVVVACEAGFVSVDFGDEVKKFQFPGIFQAFLKAEDSDVAEYIGGLLSKVEEEKVLKAKAEVDEKERLERVKREALEAAEQRIIEKKAEASAGRRGSGGNRSGSEAGVNGIVSGMKRTGAGAGSGTGKAGSVSKTRSAVKVNARANIAFKCNYCDGGKSEVQIGYDGVCSDKTIQFNITGERRSWCGSADCVCFKYHSGEMSRKELDDLFAGDGFICYESRTLRDWKALAGTHLQGESKGKPRTIKNVRNNSLCVLTTRDPKHAEDLRYIFAVFLVDESYEGDGREEGYVVANSEFKIKLSPAEARSLRFWKYYKNENSWESIKWGSGLYRYIEDEQAVQILKDIADVKKNTPDEDLAGRFYERFCQITGIKTE